jgi:thiol-disulfide isomerase/thioredoxin
MLRCLLVVSLVGLMFVNVAPRQLCSAADTKEARDAKLKKIADDYERQANEFQEAYNDAKTEAERKQIEKRRPSDLQFGKKVLTLAKEVPGDATALDAYVWMIDNLDAEDATALVDEAIGLLEKQHLNSPRLKLALAPLAKCDSARAEKLLEKIGEKSDSREMRGVASFRLALGRYGRAAEKNDSQALEQIARQLERIQKDYGDVQPDDEEEPISKLAGPVLFEIRFLQPGKEVPEITGTDLGGKPLKLSSFRGKVVLLVFWGSWCTPCMAQVPNERKLMEKYAGKPFTIVGVNCNDPRDRAASTAKQQKMNWPSFFDGEEGPIASQWNIGEFPTMFLIDAQGIILLKNPPSEEELTNGIAEAVGRSVKK